jgi:murein DD-endopeptidase MepM/ murein hydrolase activator NlpD
MLQARIRIVSQNLLSIAARLTGATLHAVSRTLSSPSLRRGALALLLPFAGVVTAFGIAPDTVTDSIFRTEVVEDLPLPLTASVAEMLRAQATQTFRREERVQRGDTLASVMARLRINDAEAMSFINTAPEARPLFQLGPGRSLHAETTAEGKLLALRYALGDRVRSLTRIDGGFTVREQPVTTETRVIAVSGEIRSSLFAATDALHIPDAVAMQLVELFSTEIDFHKDLRKNDRFTVVYEALYDRGEPAGAGRVLSAEFVNQGRTLNVMWFETDPGAAAQAAPRVSPKANQGASEDAAATSATFRGGYFTLDGRDIRKAFLRSPLEFSRVSSGFTDARYNPYLNNWAAHKGVDFVAPIGTKIKATADGMVEFAGVQSGYGNVVILKHHNKYTTLYAHMSEFAKGLNQGDRVQQGDVIGFVGMTGFTTGPHVHFEFRIDGVHHDPQSVAMPTAFPISPEFQQQFQQAAAPLARTMHLLRDAKSSSFE